MLAVAIVAEGISLIRAFRQTSGEARGRGISLHVHLRASRDPTTKTVLFEDTAAVTGNAVAIAGVALHQITGNSAYEGIAALIVAAMLVIAAFLLGRDASSLLVGRAATPEERATILEVLRRAAGGRARAAAPDDGAAPDRLLVAARVDLTAGVDSERIEDVSSEIDRELRRRLPAVAEVFIDATDRERFRRANQQPLGSQIRPHRRVVAESGVAPGVLVLAGRDLQTAHDDVVQPVARLAVRIQPAAVAARVAVQVAERIDVAVLAQPGDEQELRAVVALAVRRADAAGPRARERLDVPLA